MILVDRKIKLIELADASIYKSEINLAIMESDNGVAETGVHFKAKNKSQKNGFGKMADHRLNSHIALDNNYAE